MAKRRMRFITWCKKDRDDETKIVYEFRAKDGEVMRFTSEDTVSIPMIYRIRYAWVESIELRREGDTDFWFAKLYED